jgi:hypothetical protein
MPDQETDVLNMSDEDFLKLPTPEPVVEAEEEIVNDPEVDEAAALAAEEAQKAEDAAALEADKDKDETGADTTVVDDVDKDKDGTADDQAKTDVKKEDLDASAAAPDPEKEEVVIDYKAEYEKLLAPFKANGSEMQAKNGDDARSLMQMGANYHKNMQALKPQKKMLKLLEKNGLMDQKQLNYLIDLNNKNPEAITKLLKDSGMDPLDMVEDVKKESNYSPTQREVSDTEMALEGVLEDIRSTPSYSRTLNIITKEWDDTSCDALAATPEIIKTINGHVDNGIFDKVTEAVAYERSLGRLTGVNDFEAYKQIGDVLEQAGAFEKPTSKGPKNVVVEKTETPSKAELERIAKKKGAAPVKAAKAPASTKHKDPLDMSDEEFTKLDKKLFRS